MNAAWPTVALVKHGEEAPGKLGGESQSFGLTYDQALKNFTIERTNRLLCNTFQAQPGDPWDRYDVNVYRPANENTANVRLAFPSEKPREVVINGDATEILRGPVHGAAVKVEWLSGHQVHLWTADSNGGAKTELPVVDSQNSAWRGNVDQGRVLYG